MTSLLLGEVIIDCVRPDKSKLLFEPVNGGSPYNMALAMARLGEPVDLCASISTDLFGSQVISSMELENIGTDLVQRVTEPSTLAMVHADPGGTVSYSFYLTKTSIEKFDWKNVVVSEKHDHIHPGSYLALEKSKASECIYFLRQHADSRVISFDPNIRLHLTPGKDRLRVLFEGYVRLSTLIKASDEDLDILYPTLDVYEAARHILSLGTELVIITLGSSGSIALHKQHNFVETPADMQQQKGDSVGAGDSFMAACCWQLRKKKFMTHQAISCMERDDVATMLQQASRVAGYNCQHQGCNPPFLKALNRV